MGWATGYITQLQGGATVQCRPRGNSMQPKIKSGQLCTIVPITEDIILEKGDIVLAKVGGCQYLHLISAVQGERYQISNNKGHVNGWVGMDQIYGKCVNVEN